MHHLLSVFTPRHRRRITWIAVGGAMVALVTALLQPLQYRATMRLLII